MTEPVKKNINDTLDIDDILNNIDIEQDAKERLRKKIQGLFTRDVNLMFVGGTGVGKSSTINALFAGNLATVSDTKPETQEITCYKKDHLILWDTPGLGEGVNDQVHIEKIKQKLNETIKGQPLIDCVIVILDAHNRSIDIETQLISDLLIPNLGNNVHDKLIIAFNKCDEALNGHNNWDTENHCPKQHLDKALNTKVSDIQTRIEEKTKIKIDTIYYSAGFKNEYDSLAPYNLSKLLNHITKNIPDEKIISFATNIHDDDIHFMNDDKKEKYNANTFSTINQKFNSFMKLLNDNKEVISGVVTALATAYKWFKHRK